jgi:hypothetical protein
MRLNSIPGAFRLSLLILGALLMTAPAVRAAIFTWDGESTNNAKWSNPTNWAGSNTTVPGSGDDVVFDSTSVKTAVVDQAFTIKSLTVATNYTGTNTQNANLTVLNDFSISNGLWRFTAGTPASLTVNGNMIVNSTILCPYASAVGNGTGRTFTVGGNLTVEVSGKFDGDRMGFTYNNGPGQPANSGYCAAGHGGQGGRYSTWPAGPTYGSVTNPVELGSGCTRNNGTVPDSGGGAIKLDVTGQVVLNGVVSVNSGNAGSAISSGGAGGSVLILADSFSGSGMILANGGAAGGSATTSGGGGGRIALIRRTGSGFGNIGLQVYGGSENGGGKGAAGTLYLKQATEDYGRLIVDNSNMVTTATTMMATNTPDTTFGDVVIQNGGKLAVGASQILTVYGNWSNGASFSAESGGSVFLAGTNEVTLYGSTTFDILACTNGGKRLNFLAGTTNAVQNMLTLKGDVNGSVTNALVLRSTSASCWNLNMAAGRPQNIRHVDVQLSNAKGGTAIEAYDSVDSGNNTNWVFGTGGQTNTWTGAVSTNWGIAGNWSLARATVPNDVVVIPNGCSLYPVLDNIKTVSSLVISNGASLRLGGYGMTISGDATLAGSLIPSGTETITFGGNVDFTGGVFTQGSARVVIGGTNAQTITSGAIAYTNLFVANATGMVTFADALTVLSFTNYSGNLTFATNATMTEFHMFMTGSVTVAGGAVWTITNMSIQGAPAGKINLRSASTGTCWRLNVRNWNSVKCVDVQDSDASAGVGIYPILSSDSGNNTNWFFGESANWKRWTGSVNTSFTNGANWTPSGTPDANTLALVDGSSTNAPRLTNSLTIRALVVGGVSSVVVTVDAPLTVREDLIVLQNGTITHSASASTPLYMLDLIVGSNLCIEGRLDADGQGYTSGQSGPGYGGIVFGAIHGGRISNNGNLPYGSITAPTNLGSTAYTYVPGHCRGGGAIRAVVSNRTLFINGSLTASAKTITGGSVWAGCAGGSVFLTTGSLTGNGAIRANGDDGGGSFPNNAGSGGRVSVVLTNGNDFAAVTMEAAGGSPAVNSPCGTVYLQTAAQGPGRGTLVIDNKNVALDATSCTMIAPSVTNTTVGDVVIRNSGALRIGAGLSLTVNGSWSNGASFTADAGSTVYLAGTNDATLYGSSAFQGLVCTNAGKRLDFQAGSTYTVSNSLTLGGTGTNAGSALVLRSTGPSCWNLNMAAGKPQDIQFVDVEYSNAKGGVPILAFDSLNSGFNTNWIFGTGGQTNAWTGAVSTNWATADNWSLARATLPRDIVVITNGSPQYPVLDTIKIVGGLMISNGASLRLGGCDITVRGDATLAGSLIPNGTEVITFGGNVDLTGCAFTQGATRVVLNGTSTQLITSGAITYNALIVTNTAGTVTFAQATTANAFTNQLSTVVFSGAVNVPSFANNAGNLSFATNATMTYFDMFTTGTVTMAGGAVWAVSNLSIQGTPDGKISLRSAAPGTCWRLNVQNWSSVGYVDAQDSDASPGLGIYPILSTDSGNNTNWFFGESGNWKRWNGSVNTSFTNGSNWTPPGTPDANTLALVDGFYTSVPRLTNALTLRALTVGGASSAVVTVDAPLTVRGDLTVLQKGTITHSASADTPLYMLNLVVGSNLYLEGTMDADGQGYTTSASGPGAGNIPYGAVHGGRLSNNGNLPYGSITAPTNLGSTTFAYAGGVARGGGAIRVVVSNRTAFVNGSMTANAKTVTGASVFGGCAGGSVFLTTGCLTGRGAIRANGDDGGGSAPGTSGSGGRVSVILTRSNDFDAVATEASGVMGCNRSPCGTVYLQTAAQGPSNGTLVIDNKNQVLDATSCTLVAPSVTGTNVGDVVIRNAGVLRIYTNLSLIVSGSWSNGAKFVADSGSTVEFVGVNPSVIYASNTFCNLKCVANAKRLTFEAGKTNFVTNSLVLQRVILDSTVPTSYTYLRLSAGATQDVQRVSVRDNNATNGQTIVASRSVDLGHNVNWSITTVQGTVILFR